LVINDNLWFNDWFLTWTKTLWYFLNKEILL
jgi:hypothetical protein